LSGYVKTDQVNGSAVLWLLAYGELGELITLDNQPTPPLKGTTDWNRYALVIDVPETITTISFGLSLNGTGQAWVDDLKLEAVGPDVPITKGPREQPPRANQSEAEYQR